MDPRPSGPAVVGELDELPDLRFLPSHGRRMNEAIFGTVLPGEVLVCPAAAPSWTVLFAIAGALVTDGGDPLAHAAIVAREHGPPAVVGTVYATNRLTVGQLVTVDGTTGTVTVHPVD
jgi:phosphoenolpyruvate synthase/pyruvate phosphate dikinase